MITGHYGVGKTNLALNLALDAAARGLEVTVVDLDVVNPFFRSSDYRALLDERGIRLVAPVFAGTNVDGPSLSGTIEPDDLVVTHEEASYDAGDIIMFRSGSHTVTHRITAVTAEGYRTRGDANNTEDPAIYPESVIGVYRGRIPKLGDFALFLQKPLGMAVFIGVPVCAFVIGDVIRRRKQAQHSDEETARLREELERLKAAGSGAAPQ